jgi:uncharacterized protein YdcH (DUF465 family)
MLIPDFQKYRKLVARLNPTLDSFWTRVSFITVAEVINDEIDLNELDSEYQIIRTTLGDATKRLSSAMNQLSDEQFDEMIEEHNEVEDLIYAQEDKLNAIGFIIDSLRDLAEKSKDSNVSSLFTKAPNIRLEESRLIKLKRFTDK